jgi:hypothetical protein
VSVAKYYTTCDGSSPFQADYNTALTQFQLLNQTFEQNVASMESYLEGLSLPTSRLSDFQGQVPSSFE